MGKNHNQRPSHPQHRGTYYHPHTKETPSLEQFDVSLRRASSNNSRIIVGGDFNLPGWDWKTMALKTGSDYPALHTGLVDLLHDLGMEQLVTKSKREDNTLDLIITNTPQSVPVPRVEVVPV